MALLVEIQTWSFVIITDSRSSPEWRTMHRSRSLRFSGTCAGGPWSGPKLISAICPSAANSNSIKAIEFLVSVSKTE